MRIDFRRPSSERTSTVCPERTMKSDLYDTLGIAPNASEEEIKKAFRRVALLCHPDRNLHNPEAEERFKEANYAYSILGNKEKRGRYDLYRDFRAQSARWGLPATGAYERFLEDMFLSSSLTNFPQGVPLDLDFLTRFHPLFNVSRASMLFLRRFYTSLRKEQILDGTPFPFSRFARKSTKKKNRIFFRTFQDRSRRPSRPSGNGVEDTPLSAEPAQSGRKRDGDIEWILPVTHDEAEKGASLNVSFPGESGWQRVLLRVPRGIRDGRKLRIRKKGKWISKAEGYGDLYLEVLIR